MIFAAVCLPQAYRFLHMGSAHLFFPAKSAMVLGTRWCALVER